MRHAACGKPPEARCTPNLAAPSAYGTTRKLPTCKAPDTQAARSVPQQLQCSYNTVTMQLQCNTSTPFCISDFTVHEELDHAPNACCNNQCRIIWLYYYSIGLVAITVLPCAFSFTVKLITIYPSEAFDQTSTRGSAARQQN